MFRNMNRLLIKIERHVNFVVDSFFKNSSQFPPYAWNVAELGPTTSFKTDKTVTNDRRRTHFEELFGVDLGILWGRPTHKTPRSTKFLKRYGYYKLWRPKLNLTTCQNCGVWHEVHTICGVCYKTVKEESENIKRLYVKTGSPPSEEAIILYNNEKLPEGEFWKGKRIVEMKKDRPSWFSKDLKKRWNKLIYPEKIGTLLDSSVTTAKLPLPEGENR